jgi:acetolactate synthase small subunit
MPVRKTALYRIDVSKRAGELSRLTSFLEREGVEIGSLTVASVGDAASIEFTAPEDASLRERLRRHGLDASVAP